LAAKLLADGGEDAKPALIENGHGDSRSAAD
jgi:hypothetical protein